MRGDPSAPHPAPLYPTPLPLFPRVLPQTLTILLLISWKWISHTFSTMSSLSNVTNPNPEEKAKLLDHVQVLHRLHPLPTPFYWQKDSAISPFSNGCHSSSLSSRSCFYTQEQDHSLIYSPSHPVLPTLSNPTALKTKLLWVFLTLLFARQTTWLIMLGRIPADAHTKGRWRTEQLLARTSPPSLSAPHQQ